MMRLRFSSLLPLLLCFGTIDAQQHNRQLSLFYELQFVVPESVNPNVYGTLGNLIQLYKYEYSNGISRYRYTGFRKKDPAIEGKFKPGGISLSTSYRDFMQRYAYIQHNVHSDWVARDTLLFDKKWKIHFKETKTILVYNCIKATCSEHEAAWFCKDLAISDGPLSYGGLPGLVLEVECSSYKITAVNIDTAPPPQNIMLPTSTNYMTVKEFEERIKP